MSINRRRLLALCRKETLQIVRDPSSILIAFIMPVVLLVVMGYAINLDVDHLRLGIWRSDSGAPANTIMAASASRKKPRTSPVTRRVGGSPTYWAAKRVSTKRREMVPSPRTNSVPVTDA